MRVRTCCYVIVSVLCAPFVPLVRADDAPTTDSYYMAIFASQRDPNQPRFAHTFATFVKVSSQDRSSKEPLHAVTLSWMPATMNVVLLTRQPEPGRNLDLATSLAAAQRVGARVAMWGPYRIKKELYDRAVQQESRLKRGDVMYKAIDREFRPRVAVNCIHAISDLDSENGLLDTGTVHGDEAAQLVLDHLKRWIITPERTYPALRDRLGLRDAPIAVYGSGR
jgi:hypothetical protein